MKPSRYSPKQTPTKTIIANLIYTMDAIYERDRNCKTKIGFIANMNDWTMEHFALDYCLTFMQTLQGHKAPARVELFLIVNPPAWFGRVWKIMKPMLAPSFRKKVFMIPEEDLAKFLEPGYTEFLPDDFTCGEACTKTLVEDFISFRKHVEESSLDRAGAAMDRSKSTWEASRAMRYPRRRRRFRRASLTSKPTALSLPERSNAADDSHDSSWSNMDDPWNLKVIPDCEVRE